MSNAIEERYPEVRAFINKKIEEGKNVKDRA
jgi:hypothetical protein